MTFRSNAGLGEEEIGQWLGVSHRVRQLISYWIFLPESCIPISASRVQRLTNDERSTDEMKNHMLEYETKVKTALKAASADIANRIPNSIDTSRIIDYEDEDSPFFDAFTRVIDDAMLPHADDNADSDCIQSTEVKSDQYIGMELALPRGDDGERVHARVTKRMKDNEGRPIGTASNNPLLDSRKTAMWKN